VRILSAGDSIQDAGHRWNERTIFSVTNAGKRKLGRNMRVWYNNIKVVLKEVNFGFTLNSSCITQIQKRHF
jgi:hypothetical protein